MGLPYSLVSWSMQLSHPWDKACWMTNPTLTLCLNGSKLATFYDFIFIRTKLGNEWQSRAISSSDRWTPASKSFPDGAASVPHIPMNQTPLSNISGMVRLVVDSSSNSSSLRIATTTAGQNELKHANACGVLSDTLWMIALWDEAIMLFLVPLLFLRWWIKDKSLYFLYEVCRYQCLKL